MDIDTNNHAHDKDFQAQRFAPTTWCAPHKSEHNLHPNTTCSYCGSISPSELVAAIAAGAKLEPSDRKYGWPHKFYVDGIQNIYAGEMESLSSCSLPAGRDPTAEDTKAYDQWEKVDGHWRGRNFTPAKAITHGKFYNVHLQDATAAERLVIERAIGMHITFTDRGVQWSQFIEPTATPFLEPISHG